jgi:hypothetical protein
MHRLAARGLHVLAVEQDGVAALDRLDCYCLVEPLHQRNLVGGLGSAIAVLPVLVSVFEEIAHQVTPGGG